MLIFYHTLSVQYKKKLQNSLHFQFIIYIMIKFSFLPNVRVIFFLHCSENRCIIFDWYDIIKEALILYGKV